MEALKYTFEPDKELLDFADDFSKNYKTLPAGITIKGSGGDYFSDNKKYHIKYVDKIIDVGGNEPTTNARVGHTTKVIEVSKSVLDRFETNEDYLFFIILWCIVKLGVQKHPELHCAEALEDAFGGTISDSKADITTMEYYLKTGRSVKNVLTCFIDTLGMVATSENANRIKALLEFTRK